MSMRLSLVIVSCCSLIGACGTQPIKPSDSHIRAEAPKPGAIPAPVTQIAPLALPKPAPRVETYSVVVNNVRAQELLFALARDAKLNVDIHPGIQGTVTLNAINQTFPQILNRITKQVDMRYEIDGPNLVVMPDTPFLRIYKVDYVNMSRDATSNVAIATQIASTGGAAGTAASGNTSTTSVANIAKNRFWETLVQNIKDILRETDKILPGPAVGTAVAAPAAAPGAAPAAPPAAGAAPPAAPGETTVPAASVTYREAASVIANPETGVLSIRATSRQHEKIQEFLDQVLANAKRQVLIEATVVEVRLNNEYRQGIDWSRIRSDGKVGGFSLTSPTPALGVPASSASSSLFILSYTDPGSKFGNIAAAVSLLESFGTVKVLSSPKISVLNNQTALLKVVDNRVYFTVTATQSTITSGGAIVPGVITATPNTVSVGFVMSVTPQISETDTVLINVRPTISRIISTVRDPTPALGAIESRVPEIQTREMESIIKVNSGQIAVMGGLMQDEINNLDDSIPGLARLPIIGNIFSNRRDISTKTELVIFMRPVVIKDPSVEGDFRNFRTFLPNQEFFQQRPKAKDDFFDQRPESRTAPSAAGGK